MSHRKVRKRSTRGAAGGIRAAAARAAGCRCRSRVQLAAAVAADGDQRPVVLPRAAVHAPGLAQQRVDQRARARTSASTGSSAKKRASSSVVSLLQQRATGGRARRARPARGQARRAAARLSAASGSGAAAPDPRAADLRSRRFSAARPAAPSVSTSKPLSRHEHGVLPLRRQRMILGDHGPAVRQQPHVALARVDHRLDGEGHAGLQLQRPCRARRNAAPADPRGRSGRCRGRSTRARRNSSAPSTKLWIAWPMSPRRAPGRTAAMPRHMASKQISASRCACTGGLADEVHAAGVAVEAVLDDRDVDVDDVAGLQALVVRDAVADHVVDRGADGLRETRCS